MTAPSPTLFLTSANVKTDLGLLRPGSLVLIRGNTFAL
jgi:hypothetical protein